LVRLRTLSFGRQGQSLRLVFLVLGISLVFGVGPDSQAWQPAPSHRVWPGHISAIEFSRIINDFSEEGGFFRSDNFISNETSYLHIVDKLRQLGCSGGAYLGVGPEQNFTYISKIRPRIAFLMDIRRQAFIQHLMYKALFHISKTRAEFLSNLFSIPLIGPNAPGPDARIDQLVTYFTTAPAEQALFDRNLARIEKLMGEYLRLSSADLVALQYVYSSFKDECLDIRYRSGGPNWPGSYWGDFPTMKEILLEQDLSGNYGNFLASNEDYDFVRQMQEQNLIIPVVGDFAGPTALAAIADYLAKHGYTVSAFYTSNVEQYLFANGAFQAFAENVQKLPIDENSLFIRSFPNMREPHPASVSGHRLTTLLERISVFIKDNEKRLYPDYWQLVTTHFIGAVE
jgi:hypothetical protein